MIRIKCSVHNAKNEVKYKDKTISKLVIIITIIIFFFVHG